MKIISFVTGDTVIKVQRGFQSTTATTHANGLNIYRLDDNGRQGDSLTRSFIEHWDRTTYADNLNRPSTLFSRGLLLYANLTSGTTAAHGLVIPSEVWRNALQENATNTDVSTESWSTIFGGAGSGTGTFNRFELTAGGELNHPTNWLLCAKTDKFNKLFFNIENLNNSEGSFRKINIVVWYTAKTSKIVGTHKWKPLAFVDGTSIGEANSSLHHSGSIIFDMPDDWVSVKSSDVATGAPVRHDDSTANDPASVWTENMYGLLIGIAIGDEPDITGLPRIKCYSAFPYNNSHSQVINIIDAHHKSLNDVAIAQGITWSRQGKVMEIRDKLGRSEIRKIGAAGGNVTFGGVELTGDNYDTTKGAISRYQRESTPVYFDVERTNGDFIRIYGVISSMSEDYPTGKALPKWAIQLQVEYVVEFDSTGAWLTDGMMALGGEVINEPKYIL